MYFKVLLLYCLNFLLLLSICNIQTKTEIYVESSALFNTASLSCFQALEDFLRQHTGGGSRERALKYIDVTVLSSQQAGVA